jgi:polyisoprenoid-binding protein YceI
MKASLILLSVLFPLATLAETGVVVAAKLSPAGSFEATTSTVKGVVTKNGDEFTAAGVTVPLDTLKTKMKLRDEHMKDKYLETKKYPNAELIEAKGKGGKGTAKIKIRGVTKEVSGTYKVVGDKELVAQFPIKFSDFNITGIRYMGVGVKDDAQVTVTLPIAGAAPAAATKKK